MGNKKIAPLRTVEVIRYITPLREGGSLPAIVDADDGFNYVMKFHGAGQGIKALVADLIGSEIARNLGFKVPELVIARLDEGFGRTEPDEEIQDLLKASTGLNLASHFLSGALTYDPTVTEVDEKLASQIVWVDALLANVDRTVRNTNLLLWNREIWLIDFGASLYFHHTWDQWKDYIHKPFVQIKDHVLLPKASQLTEVDAAFKTVLTEATLRATVALVPELWVESIANELNTDPFSPRNEPLKNDDIRDVYFQFLTQRVASSSNFVNEAQHARKKLI